MEKRNNKRKTMLIAAFAVAVIALAGVGYAVASGYMATTVNSSNDVAGVYFTATQESGDYVAAFEPASEILVNTYTDATYTSPLYTIDATPTAIDVNTDGNDDYYAVQLGAAGGLDISLSGATATSYTVTIAAGGTLNGTTGHATDVWKYIVLIDNTKYVVLDGGTGSVSITKSGSAGDNQTVNVKLFIASAKEFGDYNTLVTPASGYDGKATARVSPTSATPGEYAILDSVSLAFTFTV